MPITAFASRMRRGKPSRQAYCGPCCVAKNREWRENPEAREKVRASNNASKKRRREEINANDAVRRALASGHLVKGPCYAAGPTCAGIIEAHHHDYVRPLDVVWTCRKHHRALDRKRRQARERAA